MLVEKESQFCRNSDGLFIIKLIQRKTFVGAIDLNVNYFLQGNYGLKRFCRDGYKTVLEDKHRRFYQKRELQVISE